MRRQGWVVTCFDFTYKKRGYYVTVTDYVNSPKPDDFALVHLCFMRKTDITGFTFGPCEPRWAYGRGANAERILWY